MFEILDFVLLRFAISYAMIATYTHMYIHTCSVHIMTMYVQHTINLMEN